MKQLTEAELLRYNRQIVLPGFDIEGQERLASSSALILGAGGLGCAAAQYLVAAGIGSLTLVDDDTVDSSNLHRQVLHTEDSIGEAKVDSALRSLTAINPACGLNGVDRRLLNDDLGAVISEHHVVLDCTDNLKSRELTNALCVELQTPLISGAAIRMQGQVQVYLPGTDSPCYHCVSRLIGEQALSCTQSGVMGPLVGIVGAVQAMEAVKVLSRWGTTLNGRLLLLDALTMSWRELKINRFVGCKVCAQTD